jgi:hypothetical protein
MSVEEDIIQMIPLVVQGRLATSECEKVMEQVRQSPELQAEFDFWQGVYAIRGVMPRYDFTDHPLPENLDRFAQGRVPQLSSEYSEISCHLQSCPACVEDVELLRQAVKHIPEEKVALQLQKREGFMASVFGISARAGKWLAPVVSVLLVVVGFYYLSDRREEPTGLVTIALKPQFEKRSRAGQNGALEMQVSMTQRTDSIMFTFPTDRIDIPDYYYQAFLVPKSGAPLVLSGARIECTQTELTNQCRLTLTDVRILSELKHGGSFSLSIKEEFPAGVSLEPSEYEYYFNVTVQK